MMPLNRTPPSQRGFGSAPDLTEDGRNVDSAKNVTTRQKRKRENCTCDEKLCAFSEKITDMVAKSIQGQEEKFTFIQSSILEIITQNKSVGKELAVMNSSIADIRTEMSSVRTEFNDVKDSMTDLKKKNSLFEVEIKDIIKSIEYSTARQDDLEASVKKLQDGFNIPEKLDSEIDKLRTSVIDLQLELQQQQQRNRLCNLEISGLPESKNENLSDIAIKIANYAGVNLAPEDIEHINRIQPRQSNNGRPRAVVLKLKSRLLKDNILAGIRKNRGVSTLDISMAGDSRPIYVNEHLTVDNKILYKQCREAAKFKSYQYVWIKNCRIYMRKSDNFPMTHIKHEQDLKKLF